MSGFDQEKVLRVFHTGYDHFSFLAADAEERLAYLVVEDEIVTGGMVSFVSTPGSLVNHGWVNGQINVDSTYEKVVVIDNYGTVTGGIDGYESRIVLLNDGLVDGAIYLDSAKMRIVNSGEINGPVYVTESWSSAPLDIFNGGVIRGGITGSYFTKDDIENLGQIEGDIYTWGGGDIVVNTAGTIDGDLWLSDGQDVYSAVDGVVTGTVFGEGGNDALTGGSLADRLSGGIGADVIDGGAGNDHLMGGRHFDVLTGGEGRDVFEFQRGYGGEQIMDFENNFDTLLFDEGIWGGGLTPAQLLERFASTTGDVTEIDFGGRDVITLDGIDDYRVLANDIVFG